MENNKQNTLYTLIITFIFILLASSLNAQCSKTKQWEGFSFYVPQYTKHFNKSKRYDVNGIFNSQGGNLGLAITYSKNKKHYSFGMIRNSYGDWSKFATVGVNLFENSKNQLTLNLGLADNYKGSYSQKVNRDIYEKIFPKFMIENEMIAVVMATYKRDLINIGKTKIGLQVNISPIYVNTGIFVKL